MRISFITKEVGIGLRRNLTMTMAVVISVAVSLTLFGMALLMQSQVERMKGYWYDKVEVSIFLCGNVSQNYRCTGAVTQTQREAIKTALTGMGDTVEEVYYESTAEAYQRFKEQFAGSPIVGSVSPDALPESFRVKLANPDDFGKIDKTIGNMQGVESVQDQRKLLKRFFEILGSLQDFALAVAGAMLLVTVLLVINTMRVAAFARRRETQIMRSVGAANMAIRLPFILEAAVAATAGAALSSGAVLAVKQFVIDERLAPNYTFIAFVTWQDVLAILPWLFATGLGSTILAALVTLRRYLRH